MIDISKISKAKVLAALYNSATVLGMGILQYEAGKMSEEEASELLEEHTYFDYVKGRVMKVDLSRDSLDPWLYDRDNGQGAAEVAIAGIQ